jgi:hypothetical protein
MRYKCHQWLLNFIVVLVVQPLGVGFCCLFRDGIEIFCGFVTGSSCGLGSMVKECLCYSWRLKINK